jgi:hypothetical protein
MLAQIANVYFFDLKKKHKEKRKKPPAPFFKVGNE